MQAQKWFINYGILCKEEKIMKTKNIKERIVKKANKIRFVEDWIGHIKEHDGLYCVEAIQQDNGKWLCEIELPLVNKTVRATSSDEIRAMIRVADKATKLIQEHLKDNPDIKCRPLHTYRHWEVAYHKLGGVEIRLSKEYRETLSKGFQKANEETIKAIQKMMKRLAKINGSSKGMCVQIFDKELFGDNPNIDKIAIKLSKDFDKTYDVKSMPEYFAIDNDNVIMVNGYLKGSKKN